MQKLVRLLTIVIVEWYHSVTWLLNAIHPSSESMLLPKKITPVSHLSPTTLDHICTRLPSVEQVQELFSRLGS
jgi:hypothetical protein